MKKSRITEEQVAYALRQAESGTPVADVCRQMGIAEATSYIWKKKYSTRASGRQNCASIGHRMGTLGFEVETRSPTVGALGATQGMT